MRPQPHPHLLPHPGHLPMPMPPAALLTCALSRFVLLGPPLHHYDLYRLTPGDSIARLGLQAAFSSAVTLIEWPDRLPADQVPSTATTIQLQVGWWCCVC